MQKDNTALPALRFIKQGNCNTLSGKGMLTYHLAITPDEDLLIRVSSNNGGGYFSPEWVSFKAIQKAFGQAQKQLTSFAIQGLFQGKSANSPGFLFAVLYAEGIVERDTDKPRLYVACDPSLFLAQVDQLMRSGIEVKVDPIPEGRKTAPPLKKTKPAKSTPLTTA